MTDLERLDDGTIVFAGQRSPAVIDPTLSIEVAVLQQRQYMIRKAEEDKILYARWVERRKAQAERDRQTRWFLIGAGITFVLVMLGLIALIIWWIASTMASLGAALLVIPGGIVAFALLGTIGHRCVITITHRH